MARRTSVRRRSGQGRSRSASRVSYGVRSGGRRASARRSSGRRSTSGGRSSTIRVVIQTPPAPSVHGAAVNLTNADLRKARF